MPPRVDLSGGGSEPALDDPYIVHCTMTVKLHVATHHIPSDRALETATLNQRVTATG
jgi:hypothetical protein